MEVPRADTAAASAARPGGRTARNTAAVLAATVDLILEGGIDAVTVAEVAQRSGVHFTSIYRRWGSPANLVLEAVLSQADQQVTVPDTGNLRRDLILLLRTVTAFVTSPLGQALVHLATRDDLPEYQTARQRYWQVRFTAATEIFRRAERRGELRHGVNHQTALELLAAPVHQRLLLTGQPVNDAFLRRVVDHLLAGLARADHLAAIDQASERTAAERGYR